MENCAGIVQMYFQSRYFLLVWLIVILKSTNGVFIGESSCHTFTKYTVPDNKACLTMEDIKAINRVYITYDLKLVSSNGSSVLLSTTPCSCPGSLYINDTMPALNKKKLVDLLPSGLLGIFNCGTFYLYTLFNMEYYMKKENADFCLAVAETFESQTTPVTKIDNLLETYPEVKTVMMESKKGNVLEPAFLCMFLPLADDIIYDVLWLINDNELTWAASYAFSFSDLNSTALRASNWIGNFSLNFEVACAVRAHDSSASVSGSTQRSPNFYAGITPEQNEYYVMEGVTSQIKLTSSIPFSCLLSEEAFCTYYFFLWTPSEDSCRNGMSSNGIALTNQPCGVTFNFRDWGNRSVHINLTGYVDGMINYNDRTTYLHIASTKNPMDPLGIWDDLNVEGIEVKVVDRDILVNGRQCISSNDPHMTTFDGYRWENQRTGIFVLYQHKTLPYTVHIIYSECVPRRATCNCGIAIRNGFSYYIVRTCETISLENTKLLSVPYEKEYLCADNDIRIVKIGRYYTVTLPSGTQVSFYISSWNNFIGSVRIRASVSDIESSLGLCGFTNGDTSDDFIPKDGSSPTDSNTFALSWRISMDSNDSLFSKSSSILLDTSWIDRVGVSPAETYCTCAQSGPINTYQFSLSNADHCNMTSPSQLCESGVSVLKLSSCSNSEEHKNGSRDDTDNAGIDSDLTYDTDYKESAVIKIAQWMNGWDETLAREFCLKQFKLDPAVDVCNRLVNISYGPFIDECIADIKLSGNTSFIQDTLETLKGVCLTEASRNEFFFIEKSSETNGLTFFEYISSFLCPGNCTGNGVCVNATCSCFDGFLGSDCSGKLSVPPKDFLLPSEGLCDIRSRECIQTNIFGFFDEENIIAMFEFFEIKADEIQNTKYAKTKNVTYHHYNLISVQIPKPPGSNWHKGNTDPKVYGCNISLSYDGYTYSSHVTMLIFNGQVYKCDIRTLLCHTIKNKSSESTTDTGKDILVITITVTVGLILIVIVSTMIVVMKISVQRRKSIASTLNISKGRIVPRPLPVKSEKSKLADKTLDDQCNKTVITTNQREAKVCNASDFCAFFVPGPTTEYNATQFKQRITPKKSTVLSIESYAS